MTQMTCEITKNQHLLFPLRKLRKKANSKTALNNAPDFNGLGHFYIMIQKY